MGKLAIRKKRECLLKINTRIQRVKLSNSVKYQYTILNVLQPDIVIVLQNTDSDSSKKLTIVILKARQ